MILCCGEVLIDMLPRSLSGEIRDAYLPVPGGAALNTAIALGRLDERVAVLAGLSNDLFGEQLLQAMDESNVSTALLVRSGLPTTLAFVNLVDGSAQYSFFDENSAMRMLRVDQLPDLPEETSVLLFGGISLTSDPAASTYEQLLEDVCGQHVIAFDPNVRPSFIKDEARYRERLQRMIANSDIVKVSDEDLDWLYPQETFSNVAQRWIGDGVKIVLLTSGAEGSRAMTDRFDISVPAGSVDVVDTIGAGDTFNAGVLAALSASDQMNKAALKNISGDDLRTVLTHANSLAAYTVSKAGANPPWKAAL